MCLVEHWRKTKKHVMTYFTTGYIFSLSAFLCIKWLVSFTFSFYLSNESIKKINKTIKTQLKPMQEKENGKYNKGKTNDKLIHIARFFALFAFFISKSQHNSKSNFHLALLHWNMNNMCVCICDWIGVFFCVCVCVCTLVNKQIFRFSSLQDFYFRLCKHPLPNYNMATIWISTSMYFFYKLAITRVEIGSRSFFSPRILWYVFVVMFFWREFHSLFY